MSAQLRLWGGDTTTLGRDSRVVLSIRESRRARQLILQVLPPRTIEVVVPLGARPRVVESFLTEHRSWIEHARRELVDAYPEPELMPESIDLRAIGECVAIEYLESRGQSMRYRYQDGMLSLYGTGGDEDGTLRLLRRWLLGRGRELLAPWLEAEAERIGLAPGKIQVRLQKTRWGSCSARGSVSLNAALLLVPPDLVRYLFVHELCHLRHLSHSKRYWDLVARHEPDYRRLDAELARSWRHLPGWLFALANADERQ